MATLERILSDFKLAMSRLYGDQLANVILYGSYARGDHHADSDIDLAVVLQTERVERWREVERVAPIAVELSEKYGCLIAPVVYRSQPVGFIQKLIYPNRSTGKEESYERGRYTVD